jgi:hypothetical protein
LSTDSDQEEEEDEEEEEEEAAATTPAAAALVNVQVDQRSSASPNGEFRISFYSLERKMTATKHGPRLAVEG